MTTPTWFSGTYDEYDEDMESEETVRGHVVVKPVPHHITFYDDPSDPQCWLNLNEVRFEFLGDESAGGEGAVGQRLSLFVCKYVHFPAADGVHPETNTLRHARTGTG